MTNLKFPLYFFLLLIAISCSSDDDNSATRSLESIKVTIDGNPPLDFSENINSELIPMPPQSGFQAYFTINSESASGDTFYFELPKTTEDTYSVPMSTTIDYPIPLSQVFTYQGSLIDDSNPRNAVYIQLTQFDSVGGQVKVQIDGVYYDAVNVMHNISIAIDIIRDL